MPASKPHMTPEEKRLALGLARDSVESLVRGARGSARPPHEGIFGELRGVFVTLNTTKGPERLRGCIGFPYPVKKLGEAIVEAAELAAAEDPRFPPVAEGELDAITIEVSVLTPPKELTGPRERLPSAVKIGRDGIIVSDGSSSGLLLPQVATEFGFDATEFLSQACFKAGIPPDAWLGASTKVQTFQAEVFGEATPRGGLTGAGRSTAE